MLQPRNNVKLHVLLHTPFLPVGNYLSLFPHNRFEPLWFSSALWEGFLLSFLWGVLTNWHPLSNSLHGVGCSSFSRGMENRKLFCLTCFLSGSWFFIANWDILAREKMENTVFLVQIMGNQLDKLQQLDCYSDLNLFVSLLFTLFQTWLQSFPLLNPKGFETTWNGKNSIPLIF